MKTISIHQPHYHSWLGLLDKIASSDLHIILDDVQYRKRNYQNRVQISHPSGSKLLTVPVSNKGHQQQELLIKDVQLADPDKLSKQFLTLKHTYAKKPGWKDIEADLEAIYHSPFTHLIELNIALLKHSLSVFNIQTPIKYSSMLNVTAKKNERILKICQSEGATEYIYGKGAASYMELERFQEAGIEARTQNFQHPKYKQFNDDSWVPGCFALDWYIHNPENASIFFNNHNSSNKAVTG